MAFRLQSAVIRGEISNQMKGSVTGKVWLIGRSEPLQLTLRGNCYRDLAGCKLTFANPRPEPQPEEIAGLTTEQIGHVGDITASRKVKVPTVPESEWLDYLEKKLPLPTRMANGLYLEWYSEQNGRIVIDSHDFHLTVSAPEWAMSQEEEDQLRLQAQEAFSSFLRLLMGPEIYDESEPVSDDFSGDDPESFSADEVSEGQDFQLTSQGESNTWQDDGASDLENADLEDEDDLFDEEPMDEFEWEQELRHEDRRSEAYQEAFEKYKDHPERDRLIAQAMNWPFFEDEGLEASQNLGDEMEVAMYEGEELEDFPHHPLSQRAMDFAINLQREAEIRGLIGAPSDGPEPPLRLAVLHLMSLGGKLAGALDLYPQGIEPDPGFVIAMLKRAQVPINEALHAFDCVDQRRMNADSRQWLNQRKAELFELRKDILDVMQELRRNN